jgi:hypothetical protein
MSDARIKDANWPAARDLRSQVLAITSARLGGSEKAAETDEHRRQSAVRATCGWPDRRVSANFSAERRKHATPDIGTGGLFPGQARDLEGEAHLGLEAIEEGRGSLEQRSPLLQRLSRFLATGQFRVFQQSALLRRPRVGTKPLDLDL